MSGLSTLRVLTCSTDRTVVMYDVHTGKQVLYCTLLYLYVHLTLLLFVFTFTFVFVVVLASMHIVFFTYEFYSVFYLFIYLFIYFFNSILLLESV